RNATRDTLGRYVVFLASAGLFYVFYRDLIASGFDKIPGDDGDSLLNLHVLEHWRQWLFRGHGAWLSLSNLFPLTNTLGYTDSLFLFGVLFGVIRALSIDLLTAYQCTLLVVHIA